MLPHLRLRQLSQPPRHLVIRTSFGHSPFPYAVAYHDLYTSQDYLEVIATEPNSVYEPALRTGSSVAARSKVQSTVALPDEISQNTERWGLLPASLRRKSGGG